MLPYLVLASIAICSGGWLLGYLFWQEVPSALVLVGTVLIVGSGLAILRLRRPQPVTSSPLASELLSQENP